MHTLSLQLADDIYDSLLRQAQRVGSTPEAIALSSVAQATRTSNKDSLLALLGSLEFQAPNIASQHDAYLGEGLRSVPEE